MNTTERKAITIDTINRLLNRPNGWFIQNNDIMETHQICAGKTCTDVTNRICRADPVIDKVLFELLDRIGKMDNSKFDDFHMAFDILRNMESIKV